MASPTTYFTIEYIDPMDGIPTRFPNATEIQVSVEGLRFYDKNGLAVFISAANKFAVFEQKEKKPA